MTGVLARSRLAALLPRPPAGPLPLAVPRRRVYILPSRFGLVYALALFVLMIGALNYNNNAAILLALVLAMAALASAHAAVRFLSGLRLATFQADEAFAGQTRACRALVATTEDTLRGELVLTVDGQPLQARPGADGQAGFDWQRPAGRRGRQPLGRVRLATAYPLGLFRAWTVLDPQADVVVYPAPESPPQPLPERLDPAAGRPLAGREDEDWHALREFQRGDGLRDIAWKVSARHDRWLVAETRGVEPTPALRFSLAQVAGLSREAGLSRLCRWVLLAEAAGRPYGLDLPGSTLPPGLGGDQRRRALTALAELP